MSSGPQVTVMMPAYNREDLIGRAIDSVLMQTLRDWELVIVDDGSTDATLDIARRYAARDPRIKVFQNPRNMGIAHTRNHALAQATGRFITPLDSDDWYRPERLELMLAAAEMYHTDLLADDLLLVRDGDTDHWATLSEVCGEVLHAPMHVDMRALLVRLGFENAGITLGLTKPFVRRQFLADHGIRYDTTLEVVEDYWMLADCVRAGAKFVMIPTGHYCYRQHANHSTLKANGSNDLASTQRRLREFVDTSTSPLDAEARAVAIRHIKRLSQLENFSRFVDLVRDRQAASALAFTGRHPQIVAEFARRIPQIVVRRYRRYVKGDLLAFDPIAGRAGLPVLPPAGKAVALRTMQPRAKRRAASRESTAA